MTLSPLNTALVHIVAVRNANRKSLDAARRDGDRIQEEFYAGRVTGLSQALDILRVIGEQPVSAAAYIAGSDDQSEALAKLAQLLA